MIRRIDRQELKAMIVRAIKHEGLQKWLVEAIEKDEDLASDIYSYFIEIKKKETEAMKFIETVGKQEQPQRRLPGFFENCNGAKQYENSIYCAMKRYLQDEGLKAVCSTRIGKLNKYRELFEKLSIKYAQYGIETFSDLIPELLRQVDFIFIEKFEGVVSRQDNPQDGQESEID